jgi:hypothetical protein
MLGALDGLPTCRRASQVGWGGGGATTSLWLVPSLPLLPCLLGNLSPRVPRPQHYRDAEALIPRRGKGPNATERSLKEQV